MVIPILKDSLELLNLLYYLNYKSFYTIVCCAIRQYYLQYQLIYWYNWLKQNQLINRARTAIFLLLWLDAGGFVDCHPTLGKKSDRNGLEQLMSHPHLWRDEYWSQMKMDLFVEICPLLTLQLIFKTFNFVCICKLTQKTVSQAKWGLCNMHVAIKIYNKADGVPLTSVNLQ